jgi:hypothetical protein
VDGKHRCAKGAPKEDGFLTKSALRLHLQPKLDQAADGFGAAGFVDLPAPPTVDLVELIVTPALTNQRTDASRWSADLLFVVRNSCSLHDFMLTERQAEGKR